MLSIIQSVRTCPRYVSTKNDINNIQSPVIQPNKSMIFTSAQPEQTSYRMAPPGIVMRLFTISWFRHSVWIFRLPRTSYVVNNDDVAPPLSFEQLQSRRVCNPTPHPMTIKNDAEHHSKCTDAPPARIKSSDTNILVISFFTQLQLIRAEGTSLQEDDASHRINYSSVISRS